MLFLSGLLLFFHEAKQDIFSDTINNNALVKGYQDDGNK